MKGARRINSSTLILGKLLELLTETSPPTQAALEVGIRRAMGRHCYDDRISYAHVLFVDLSLVLRRPARPPDCR